MHGWAARGRGRPVDVRAAMRTRGTVAEQAARAAHASVAVHLDPCEAPLVLDRLRQPITGHSSGSVGLPSAAPRSPTDPVAHPQVSAP